MSRAFKFRLQVLLDQAAAAEQNEKARLAVLLAALAAAHRSHDDLQRRRAQAGRWLLSAAAAPFLLDAALAGEMHLAYLAQRIAAQERAIAEISEAVRAQQAALERAAVRRKQFERLRDRQLQAHLREQQRQEQRALDDLASVAAARRAAALL